MKEKITRQNTETPRDSEVLFSTYIRTFQQKSVEKKRNSGKHSFVWPTPPHFCGKHKAILLNTNEKGEFHSAKSFGIRCNLWSCPVCRIIKAKKLRWKLKYAIQMNNLDHLFSITLDPKKIPYKYKKKFNSTGKYISYLFNKYMTYIKRLMKKKIKYVWIKEFQPVSGNAHLHMVFNTYLPIKVLRNYWSKIGGGVQMRIEKVRSIDATAIYFTKYVTKMLDSTENFTVKERRYSFSHNCILPPKKLLPKTNIEQLLKNLPYDKFLEVYNLLKNEELPDGEIILAPHQEKLNL